ncbi:hypothetical protein CCACVL1_08562 [Corchorus capsularis]|uniref:Uncharacterized protein n=1 Tax=Corchorus capsularis TaxID=210143 RepID=A0A1R3IZQ8_COCAP|nr:hypothetical protein CCACVL1_08562 [Corchorus capsularis]
MVRKNVPKRYLKKKLVINLISIAPPASPAMVLDIIPRCTLQADMVIQDSVAYSLAMELNLTLEAQ